MENNSQPSHNEVDFVTTEQTSANENNQETVVTTDDVTELAEETNLTTTTASSTASASSSCAKQENSTKTVEGKGGGVEGKVTSTQDKSDSEESSHECTSSVALPTAQANSTSAPVVLSTTKEKANGDDKTGTSAHVDTAALPPLKSTSTQQKRVGCAHYKRRAKFVTPCCNKFYMCRYCHDENESHYFNRKTVTELICTECDTRQRVQAECEKCGARFGRYTCLICNLFDDEDKNQYHCDGCGICRVGGKGRFFHCKVCNMCLPLQLKIEGHRCVENVSRSNCPVCLEDIHTSRIPCHIPDCGHLLHRTCFEELLSSGHYACPTCQTSMMDMKQLWDYLDSEVVATPMPKEYENYMVDILCKDCHKESSVKFHVVGLKCAHCGAYNTCRTKGAAACITTPTTPEITPATTPTSPTNGETSNRAATNTTPTSEICESVHLSNGNDEA